MRHKKVNKRKVLLIVLGCVAALAVAAVCLWFFWLKDYLAASQAAPVYVNTVASITGMDAGATPRYAGVVEPQETYEIKRDESKTVAEILVAEGDQVSPGTPLFRYDTEEMQLTLDQAELDLEGIANQITTLEDQLDDLEDEKDDASEDEQYAYTVQIQAVELQIKNQEYNSSVKKSEIDKLKEDLANAEVYADVEGTVKEINENGGTDSMGQPLPFMSILSSGQFRVKGTISELNLSSLSAGQAVVIHSRVDPQMSWTGMVDVIEMEPTEDQNTRYYYGADSGNRSSRYNFYVLLDDPTGLILGQHVYIEPDLGPAAQREGIWLPASYIAHDDLGSFVWAAGEDDKLEMRLITLGDYDGENDLYQIQSGLAMEDRIAYPSEELVEGGPVVDAGSTEGAAGEEGVLEDGSVDDGMMVDDGFYAEDGSYEEYEDYAADDYSTDDYAADDYATDDYALEEYAGDGDAAVSQTAGQARMESYAAWTQDSEGSL